MKILVLGAGPAGLAAADAASAHGAQVIVIDDNVAPGGQIWRGGPKAWAGKGGMFARASRLAAALAERSNVEILAQSRIVSALPDGDVLLETPQGPRRMAWDRVIVCGGARELLLPFPGWTLPGVTGAGGLQAMAKGGLPLAGKRVVIAGTGPLLLATAQTAREKGADVRAIAELRSTRELAGFAARLALSHQGKAWQALGLARELRGVPYLHGASVIEAGGDGALERVLLQHGDTQREIACDFLAVGFGLLPNTELGALFGLEQRGGAITVDAAQRTSHPRVWAAGECTGIGGVDKALAEGRIAGLAAAGAPIGTADEKDRAVALSFGKLLARSFAPPASLKAMCRPSTLVCRCEDVSASALAPFHDWRSAKLQTRAGMGPCQGRVCGSACEFLFGWQPPEARPPIFPTTAATLASLAPSSKDET